MVRIGNFFFRYRNMLFPLAAVLVFVPSPPLLPSARTALAAGILVLVTGQLLRVLTIGLFYIKRGGKGRRVYADDLVTEGLFSHCRNPLYLGNILMLIGFGLALNSPVCFLAGSALFIFIYACIVRAEEAYLREKFGSGFDDYCRDVPRWRVRLRGLVETLQASEFQWRRVLTKEYGTLGNWMVGLPLALYLRRHGLAGLNFSWRAEDGVLLAAVSFGVLTWAALRTLKKSRAFQAA